MRLLVVLICGAMLSSCGSGNVSRSEPNKETSEGISKSYVDLGSYPEEVQAVAKTIAKIPSGVSRSSYQEVLRKTGVVKVPFQHFKDHEYYWSIKLPKEDGEILPFVVAGGFAGFSDDLSYSPINIVSKPHGVWRTIWLHEHDRASKIPVRIRGGNSLGNIDAN